MTDTRARDGSAWDLARVEDEMQHPVHRDNLILVTAHRGDWDICPENTIEGAMIAMDQKLELIELDVRVTTDGIPYLTHDWDLRGEALNSDRARSTKDNIYTLSDQELEAHLRRKPDRHGYAAKDSLGKGIYLQSFRKVLDTYYDRVRRIQDGVVDGVVRRGAGIVVDIKGEDRVVNTAEYKESLQYGALREILRTVRAFEEDNNVSLQNVLIYKINLKSMRQITEKPMFPPEEVTAEQFRDFLHEERFSYIPGLIFIVFPEDWNKEKNPKTYELYQPWLMDYREHYPKLLAVDWQTRYPGINLEPESRADVDGGRGVGAFVSYNPFPEGGRRSDGTCTYQGDYVQAPDRGSVCLQQGLKLYASASLEFFFPPKDTHYPLLATSITTDMYQNAANYLNVTDRRHMEYIAWSRSEDLVGHRTLSPEMRSIDLNYTTLPECHSHIIDTVSERCIAMPQHIKVNTDRGGVFVTPSNALKSSSLMTVGPNDLEFGFTVAISLPATVAQNVPLISSVLTVLGNDSAPVFTVLRGPKGRWYVGKRVDRDSSVNFNTELWDPVSPCYIPAESRRKPCIREMLYISFRPTGEVRLDDFGIYGRPSEKVFGDWRSSLLNYGIPVSRYQSGVPPYGDHPNPPKENPAFVPIRGVGLSTQPNHFYGADSIYKNSGTAPFSSLPIGRFALWQGGMIGDVPDNQTSLFRGVEQAILRDMASQFPSYTFQTNWLPCNTGQYEVNKDGETLNGPTTQYDPKDIATPCNPTGQPVPVPPTPRTGAVGSTEDDPQ